MSHLSHPKYRPDIDGLRAIAVLSVIAFHAFPKSLRGGFVGVDVFFVISGYLISTILFENLDRGTFSFAEFYARRIKRIFPALLVVLVACYAFGWYALLADEYRQLGKHIAAGAGFVSNIALWGEAGYFDNAVDTKPLLHLWSLGIEEQFYIAWPFLLWVAWRQRFSLLSVTTLVALASFGLNLYQTRTDAVAAFYAPQTRVWELLFGSLLAWVALYRKDALAAQTARLDGWLGSLTRRGSPGRDGAALSNVLSCCGLALLGYGFLHVRGNLGFPGAWAVVPVLGAGLLIAGGPTAWVNRTILAHRVAVWVGLSSFPLYLWHWPLLSFARIVESEAPGAGPRRAAVLLAFFLAWLTYRFVERPLRFGTQGRGRVAVLVAVMTVVGLAGYDTYRREGYDFRASVQGFANNKNELVRTPAVDAACLEYVGTETPLFPYCRFTGAGGDETVAVLGDSHAHVAYPGIAELLRERGINTVLLANSSCPPLIGAPIAGRSDASKRACLDQIRALLDVVLARDDIRRVLFVVRGPVYFTGTEPVSGDRDVLKGAAVSLEAYGAGTQRTIDRLVEGGKEVYYVTENPELGSSVAACIVRPLRTRAKDCSVERTSVLARQGAYLEVVAALSGTTVIESLSLFCPTARCLVFDSAGALLYADDNHLSVAGSRFQADRALPALLDAQARE